jgi:uncharacterized phage infection (PIP) family protein YhgE
LGVSHANELMRWKLQNAIKQIEKPKAVDMDMVTNMLNEFNDNIINQIHQVNERLDTHASNLNEGLRTLSEQIRNTVDISQQHITALEQIRRSASFRLGRFLTAPLRVLKKLFQK